MISIKVAFNIDFAEQNPTEEKSSHKDSLKPIFRSNPRLYWRFALPFAVKNVQILVKLVFIIKK